MQRKSVGKQLWDIVSPLAVKMAVALVVEVMVMLAFCMKEMAELITITDPELLYERTTEICMEVLQYSVELSGLMALVTIPFLYWMMHKDRRKEREALILQKKKAPLEQYVMVVGISLPFALAFNNLIMLTDLARYSEAYQETAEALYEPSILVQILCLGIVIPIMEEMVFRGLIYRRVRNATTPVRGMLCSAIFFGMYHGNLIQTIYGIGCGCLFVYLYEKFGTLWAPILSHMLMNLLSIGFTEIGGFLWIFQSPGRMAFVTIASAAAASAVFVLIQKMENPFIPIKQEEQEF